jgi:hypothetical protein
LLNVILTSEIVDGCFCACTEHGCVPGLNFLGRFGPLGSYYGPPIPWSTLVSQLSSSFDRLFMALVRLWTFQALELTHTCCRHGCGPYRTRLWKPYPFSIPVDDEVQEIRDEERELISLHQALMVELTDTWRNSPENPKLFLSKIWRPRIQQIKKQRTKMSDEQLVELSKIGVNIEVNNRNDAEETDDAYDEWEGDWYDEEDDEVVSLENEESISIDCDVNESTDEKDVRLDEDQSTQQEHKPDLIDASGTDHVDSYNGQTIEGIDDVEVAEILREAARVNGLEDYDVWFKMIERPDPRLDH